MDKNTENSQKSNFRWVVSLVLFVTLFCLVVYGILNYYERKATTKQPFVVEENPLETTLKVAGVIKELSQRTYFMEEHYKNYDIPKNLNSISLTEYFYETPPSLSRMAPNRLMDTDRDKITYDFYCKEEEGKCGIIIDINGRKGPNKIWEETLYPKDRFVVYFADKHLILPQHIYDAFMPDALSEICKKDIEIFHNPRGEQSCALEYSKALPVVHLVSIEEKN